MVLTLAVRDQIIDQAHKFVALDVDPNSDWMTESAMEYQKLLMEFAPPIDLSTLEGIQILDVSRLQTVLTSSLLPPAPSSVLDVVRADFGEVLAYLVLEQRFLTRIGIKAVRERERGDLPARGIDVVGVEDGEKLRLVLAEVKVSDEERSPPEVVDRGHDCLRAQLTAHATDKESTLAKIAQVARRTRSTEVRDKILAAMLLWEQDLRDRVELICCGFVVRSTYVYQRTDFGSLVGNCGVLGNASLRFLILVVPDRIQGLVSRWYELASSGGAG